HVKTDQPIDFDLKWRGMALTIFDGKTWKNEGNAVEEEDSYSGRYLLRRLQSRRLNLPPLTRDARDFRLLRYRIILEPIGTNVIFLAPVPVELGGRFREIGIDDNGSISNNDRSRLTESYDAVSQIPLPSLETLRSVSGRYPPGFPTTYTTLPPNLDPRVGDLARQATAKAH